MKDAGVAHRYAQALFLLTERRGETARTLEDLRAIHGVVRPATRIGRMLLSPDLRLADKRRALTQVLEGRIGRPVTLFLDLLLRKKRFAELDDIVSHYGAIVEKAQGIQRAEVVSAVPLTADERDRIHREVERFTGSRVLMSERIDPAVVGGSLVRVGDQVYDRTVHTLLERMREQLSHVSL